MLDDRNIQHFSGLPEPQDYQELVMNAPMGIFIATPDDRFLSANPALARLLGYASVEELVSLITDISTQICADPGENKKFKHLLTIGDRAINHECRARRRDGSIIWLLKNARAVRNKNGEMVYYQGFVTDITEQKQTEEALRKSEENLLEAHSIARMGRWELDLGSNHLTWSDGIFELFEVSRDSFSASYEAFLEFVHPDDRDMVNRAYLESVENKKSYDIEHRLLMADGRIKWVNEVCRTEYDSKGKPWRSIGVVQDITQRRQAEENLRESEKKFRELAEGTEAILWEFDLRSDRWNYVAPQAKRILGFSPDEWTDLEFWRQRLHPEDRRWALQYCMECTARGEDHELEYRFIAKNGNPVWVRDVISVESGAEGPIRIRGFMVDITRLKQAESELILAKEQAEAASRAKTEFLGNMSHEIRTPLNGIMGMLQLLETTGLDAEQAELVQTGIRSTHRLTRLLSDILDLSRLEAGKLAIRVVEFAPKELCNSVYELFQFTSADKKIPLEIHLDPALPAKLAGDEARVRQILFNLVGNALKYTDEGSVKMEIKPVSRVGETDLRVLFKVSDTGIGIPAGSLEEIMKPFCQLDNSSTRKYQGAGLGLSIVWRLVKLMEGTMDIDSFEGQGTAVCVTLPFRYAGKT